MSSISSNQPIHIEILGQSFSIRTDDSPEYIQSLVDELKQRYARISARMNVADPLRVTILAGLFLLDDAKKMQNQSLPGKSERSTEGGFPADRASNISKRGNESGKGQPSNASFDEEQILAQLDKRLGELGL
jgi:cell division protein ZapA (FtsZ GTPase activity inhibitor)